MDVRKTGRQAFSDGSFANGGLCFDTFCGSNSELSSFKVP